jgi:hypothetical protein
VNLVLFDAAAVGSFSKTATFVGAVTPASEVSTGDARIAPTATANGRTVLQRTLSVCVLQGRIPETEFCRKKAFNLAVYALNFLAFGGRNFPRSLAMQILNGL